MLQESIFTSAIEQDERTVGKPGGQGQSGIASAGAKIEDAVAWGSHFLHQVEDGQRIEDVEFEIFCRSSEAGQVKPGIDSGQVAEKFFERLTLLDSGFNVDVVAGGNEPVPVGLREFEQGIALRQESIRIMGSTGLIVLWKRSHDAERYFLSTESTESAGNFYRVGALTDGRASRIHGLTCWFLQQNAPRTPHPAPRTFFRSSRLGGGST